LSRTYQDNRGENYRLNATLKALGAGITEKKAEIPATFSMPAEGIVKVGEVDTDKEFEEFLRPSKVSLPVVEYTDRRDLKDDLRPLLEAAGVIMAVHTIRFKQGTTDAQLKDMLKAEVRKFVDERASRLS
jgi:hypothetical protein